jgi:predicted RNA methylase|tara:strand:+ start:2048 stop:2869 length:822 start_codon:yes stop_codon:yes gene_type:complete
VRLAWVLAVAAGIKQNDIVLEPSGGTGVLALWSHLAGATLLLNEIDDLRAACLADLFPNARLSSHDGELIDELLPSRHNPGLVIMNPPFARSVERGTDGRSALRHLRSAWRRLASGGRLVAIMPDGFKSSQFVKGTDSPCTLRLDARITRSFSQRGTGITVRMVVFEKLAAECIASPTEAEDFAALYEACQSLPARGMANACPPRRIAIGKPFALMPCATWSKGASTNSKMHVVSPPGTIRPPTAISAFSTSSQSGCGCANLLTGPTTTSADL